MTRLEECLPLEVEGERSFELLIGALAAQLARLAPNRLDGAIEAAQRQICLNFGLDSSELWQRGSRAGTMLLTHAYAPGSSDQVTRALGRERETYSDKVLKANDAPKAYRQMPAEVFFPWISQELQKGRSVVLASLDNLPPQARRDREIFQEFQTCSALVAPLWIGQEWVGCVSFASRHGERIWTPQAIGRLELVTDLFSHALARQRCQRIECAHEARRGISEHSLCDSEAVFKYIADSAPVLIWISGRDKQCTFFNKPWLDFRGRSMEQELAAGWAQAVHPQETIECAKTYAEAFDARATFVMEYRLRRHDGRFRWVSISGRPRFDPDGQFTGYIGTCVDVTERVEAEQAAQDLNGRLINAQEEERARVARELHDDVSQRLARLAIDMGRLRNASAAPINFDAVVCDVHEELVRLAEDVHALSYDLHPSVLVDLGLDAALRAECEHVSKHSAISVEIKFHDLPDAVPRAMALGLFRIAQEALRNAVRHGRAMCVELTLRGIDHGLQLAVRDDGVGFDSSRARHRPSLGLASMKERARLLNGELDIESEPGQGTMVVAWVPLKE